MILVVWLWLRFGTSQFESQVCQELMGFIVYKILPHFIHTLNCCFLVAKSCQTLCNPTD